jgi:outer membrane receptor for ferrienterochelin and colicin
MYWPNSGNPDLKPEHGWAYELRLESSPTPAMYAALSLFMRNINDRIFWLPIEDGLWQPQNVNYISIKGLDIETKTYASELMSVSFEFTYLNSNQKNNEIVYDFYDSFADTGLTIIEEIERKAAFTPTYVVSAKLDFHLPYEITSNIFVSFISKRINYYRNYANFPNVSMYEKSLDPYCIINLHLTKKISRSLALSAGLKNVLDTKYATQFGHTMDDLDYPMPGRLFFAQVSWQQGF